METIARLMLAETAQRMRAKGMDMALTRAAMAKLLEIGLRRRVRRAAAPPRHHERRRRYPLRRRTLLAALSEEGDTAVIDYDI